MRMKTGCSLALLLAAAGWALAAEPLECVQVELQGSLPGEKALVLHLGVAGERVTDAFATSPRYSNFPHTVDAAQLKLAGGRLRGQVAVTLVPDPWTPKDGKPIDCRFEIDARVADGKVAGVYRGTRGRDEVRGQVMGIAAPQPAQGRAIADLRIFQAMLGLVPADGSKAPNMNYALDMTLRFRPGESGKARWARFQTPVPDYRPYTAVVRSLTLREDGFRWIVEMAVDANYHGKHGTADGTEAYTYRLEGMRIGDTLAGTARIALPNRKDTRPFWGRIDRVEPPRPDGNVAWLRLHQAMRKEAPVLLNLAIHEKAPIHGLAWAPGYNHQPHGIDASRLKLEGNRLHGPVVVHVVPDVYHDQDVYFDLHYDIDVTFEDGNADGTFTGRDGDLKTENIIAGEVRPKDAPSVTQPTLKKATLKFGYAMPDRKDPAHRSLTVDATFQDGRLQAAHVVQPTNAGLTVEVSELVLAGDRLTGKLTLQEDGSSKPAYAYTFDAIVNGAKAGGYWRGQRDGKDILTKSSKFGAELE